MRFPVRWVSGWSRESSCTIGRCARPVQKRPPNPFASTNCRTPACGARPHCPQTTAACTHRCAAPHPPPTPPLCPTRQPPPPFANRLPIPKGCVTGEELRLSPAPSSRACLLRQAKGACTSPRSFERRFVFFFVHKTSGPTAIGRLTTTDCFHDCGVPKHGGGYGWPPVVLNWYGSAVVLWRARLQGAHGAHPVSCPHSRFLRPRSVTSESDE